MVTSASKIAENAKAAITKLDQELEQLRRFLAGYQEEAAQLEADAAGQTERLRSLASARESAATEVHRAELAAEMAQGTDREQATNEHVRACSETWDAARLALETEIEQSGQLAVTRTELRTSLDQGTADISKMLNEQSTRRDELMSIYTQNHDEHGREEYRVLLAEEAKLLKQVEVERRRLDNAEARLAKWRSEVSERFVDWPEMQGIVVTKHGPGATSGYARLLQVADKFFADLEPALQGIPHKPDQLDHFIGQANLWAMLALPRNELRLLFDGVNRKWTDQQFVANYSMLGLQARRKNLAEALKIVDLSERHTSAAEYERISKMLAELAAEDQLVELETA